MLPTHNVRGSKMYFAHKSYTAAETRTGNRNEISHDTRTCLVSSRERGPRRRQYARAL